MLLTMHVGELTGDGTLPVTITNLGGDESADLCVSPTSLASELLQSIDAELGLCPSILGYRKYMLADGRISETTLSEWLEL